MKIGMMNHPKKSAVDEAEWAAANGFDFLDLSVEGPGAEVEMIDADRLGNVLRDAGMSAVGHTAWFLPFHSPYPAVRAAAVEGFCETLPLFARLGVEWVNVHAGKSPRFYPFRDSLAWQAEAFATLAVRAAAFGLRVMVENPAHPEFGPDAMETLLAGDNRLGLHLDFGHAHVNTPDGLQVAREFVTRFGPRLGHVHLSDNNLLSDGHMALDAGLVPWRDSLRLLRESGYDRTVTLEVFTPEPAPLLHSAQLVREFLSQP